MNRTLATFALAEERNKLSHFTVQGYDLAGVIHGGTNDGEEILNYMRFGIDNILGFEPLGFAFDLCAQNCRAWKEELNYTGKIDLFNLALSDFKGRRKLNVTAGDGKGSSLFMPNMEHPEVKANWTDNAMMVRTEQCFVNTFENWHVDNPSINLALFDTLVLDTQGNEWEILQGMGDLLKGFKYLCIELSITPAYAGETTGPTVAAWLEEQGFTLDSPQYDHNDWFFVRSDIKPISDMIYRGKC